MKLSARVPLSLPKIIYNIVLKYDTYEKATFDSYLIAALVKKSKKKKEAYEYIDSITGDGSLNIHFRKLYDEISQFTTTQIDRILDNSLYPVTVIDNKHKFEYYPMLNLSKFNNQYFNYNIRENKDLFKQLLLPENSTFLELSVDDGILKNNTDTYDAIFTKDKVEILMNKVKYEISNQDFLSIYKSDILELNGYLGDIGEEITETNWKVLSNSILSINTKDKFIYRNANGEHTILTNDYIKTFKIINVFGMYFFNENKYDFNRNNKILCEDALNYMMDSQIINEFKTKTIINILDVVTDTIAQKAVVYILNIKMSKEIAEFGVKLIKNGLNHGWNNKILCNMKKQVSSNNFKYLYELDNDLGFDVDDLIHIDRDILNNSDLRRVNTYLEEKENILKNINIMIGEITNSGLREKIKNLPNTDTKKIVKKFLDKYIGHNKKDYNNMSISQLTNEFEIIKKFYDYDYKDMINLINNI